MKQEAKKIHILNYIKNNPGKNGNEIAHFALGKSIYFGSAHVTIPLRQLVEEGKIRRERHCKPKFQYKYYIINP